MAKFFVPFLVKFWLLGFNIVRSTFSESGKIFLKKNLFGFGGMLGFSRIGAFLYSLGSPNFKPSSPTHWEEKLHVVLQNLYEALIT